MQEEWEGLAEVDSLTVLDYIRSTFEILNNMKLEEPKEWNIEDHEDLEQMLQRLEGDVWQHIRVEQQLKLHIESIQEKVDEAETKTEIMKQESERTVSEKERMDEILNIWENQITKLQGKLKEIETKYNAMESHVTEVEELMWAQQRKYDVDIDRYK